MRNRLILVFVLEMFLIVGLGGEACAQSYLGSSDDRRLAPQPKRVDIFAACADDRARDLTCEKIIELNDFARDFIDTLVRRYNLKRFEREIGTVAGVALYRKATLRIYKDIELTFNLDTDIVSINYGRSF